MAGLRKDRRGVSFELCLDAVLFAVVCVHVFICPYTKVEESFNVQATHDLLTLGPLRLGEFDHLEFPGVVPRTFWGPIGMALAVWPLRFMLSKASLLIAARIALGAFSVACAGKFRRAFCDTVAEGVRGVSVAFVVLTCCQFHLPFYMSRPLANTLAMGVVNLALARWLRDDASCVAVLALACVVFRCDCVLLAGPLIATSLITRRMRLVPVMSYGLIGSVSSIAATVAIDSYFWGRVLWPEFTVLWYNTAENKSSNWGTEPFTWYLTSALPRSLLCALVLAPLAMSASPPTLRGFTSRAGLAAMLRPNWDIVRLAVPTCVFIGLYSFLPHKVTIFFSLFCFTHVNTCINQPLTPSLLPLRSFVLYSQRCRYSTL